MEKLLRCPWCESYDIVATAEQMFYVNSGEHYCHSVKTQDDDSKVQCLDCDFKGYRNELVGAK